MIGLQLTMDSLLPISTNKELNYKGVLGMTDRGTHYSFYNVSLQMIV